MAIIAKLCHDPLKETIMATMNISLPDQMKEWVEAQVASGRYANSSDVMRDLVRREQEREDARAEFDRLVEEGLKSPRVSMTREALLERTMAAAAEAVRAKKSA
jgi:antitoxin ParD1/3/4